MKKSNMAVSRLIKNRIRATKNIKQITRAMEAVSAVKMRKSQAAALQARPYALAALEVLKNIRSAAGHDVAQLHPLMIERTTGLTCFVVITSDKGLAGSFNSNVIRQAAKLIREAKEAVEIIAVGKKGRDFFKRRGFNVVEFTGFGDFADVSETKPVAEKILALYPKYKEVILIYTNFISALRQEVSVHSILPFKKESLIEIVEGIIPLRGKYSGMPQALQIDIPKAEYIFEPDPQKLLNTLLPKLLEIEVHHAILEGNASEHSARMVSMRSASQNAGELMDKLTISYNKARQAQITKELTEITAGREALNA